jgi:hypothetical protein
MTKNRKHHQPLSSLLHRLFRQPSTPGPLLSMIRPLVPCLSPSVASSTPKGESHPQTSFSFGSLPPSPPAPHHSLQRSISVMSTPRDEWKVSILFGLHRISPETHLVMFDWMAAAVPRLISPLRAAGDPPLLLSLIDIDCKELQRRGEGENSVWVAL